MKQHFNIEIEQSGMLATIQDGGRIGFRNLGIPQSGYMDSFAARCANWLVGNDLNATLLELFQCGAKISFNGNYNIAITGADFDATLNEKSIRSNKNIEVSTGDILLFKKNISGNIAYLAIGGTWEASKILGSTSTYHRMNWGGKFGRSLKKGDQITIAPSGKVIHRQLPEIMMRSYAQSSEIRYIAGVEEDHFSQELENFMAQNFKISSNSDRMGYRLLPESNGLNHHQQIKSSVILPGVIQLPPDGNPIVLLADGQTTGGYPRIGSIINYDIPYFVQRAIGTKVRFKKVSLEEAQALMNYEKSLFELLKRKNLTQ